jgi:uncharacterized protein (DUF736 family)
MTVWWERSTEPVVQEPEQQPELNCSKDQVQTINLKAKVGVNTRAAPSANRAPKFTVSETTPSEKALVPSWRLAEESQKRRDLKAKLEDALQRIDELEAALRSSRNEWQFRRRSTSN